MRRTSYVLCRIGHFSPATWVLDASRCTRKIHRQSDRFTRSQPQELCLCSGIRESIVKMGSTKINADLRTSTKKHFPGSYVHKWKHSKTSLHAPWEWKKQKQRERMIYTIHRNSICWEESPATGHSLVKVSNLHRWNTHDQLPELPTDERALVDC